MNLATIEQDASLIIAKLPTIAADMSEVATLLAFIPGLQAEAAMLKEAAAAVSALSIVSGDVVKNLTALAGNVQSIKAAIQQVRLPA